MGDVWCVFTALCPCSNIQAIRRAHLLAGSFYDELVIPNPRIHMSTHVWAVLGYARLVGAGLHCLVWWHGIAWDGVECGGMVWHVTWHGVARGGAWHDIARHVAWCCGMPHHATQCPPMPCNAMPCHITCMLRCTCAPFPKRTCMVMRVLL